MDIDYQNAVLKVLRGEGILAVAEQFEVGRFLSKLGTLDSDKELLRFISAHITKNEVIELREYLRQFRSEDEWISEFEGIFVD